MSRGYIRHSQRVSLCATCQTLVVGSTPAVVQLAIGGHDVRLAIGMSRGFILCATWQTLVVVSTSAVVRLAIVVSNTRF